MIPPTCTCCSGILLDVCLVVTAILTIKGSEHLAYVRLQLRGDFTVSPFVGAVRFCFLRFFCVRDSPMEGPGKTSPHRPRCVETVSLASRAAMIV